jgi:hypothetical protein
MTSSPDIQPFTVIITPMPTPSPTDPVGANAYYEAVGMAQVAWGRLEGQLTGCLIMLLQIAFHRRLTSIGTNLPQQWKHYETLWTKAFNLIDELRPYQAEANALMLDMVLHKEDRNLVAHGLWRDFRQTAPYTMDVLRMRKTKKIQYGLEFFTMPVTIQHLWTIRDTANGLNDRLLSLGMLISGLTVSLFGQPSPNARIL